ncbi:MBL fold metallo-hydrolase RNA specificity domain-containing protein [Methyloversatilis sp. MC4-4]|uniref:MBL fold metallo-hydrolase RNA specificity domain-containing protein n=1 Tax=Methyloversatilis sp. MC4-4 TaxID=3132824 RepID=UPI003CEA30EB
MKIRFLGAAGTVTGSRYLLTHGGHRLLVDCGLFQGVKNIRSRNWKPFPIAPRDIEAVVLTHAHLDHSGFLPRLMREGFRGPVWSTSATRELVDILLEDSAHLQEEDARHANRYGYSKHHPAEPLYTSDDARQVMKQFRSAGFDEPVEIGPFRITFTRAGHILGAASVRVDCAGRSITFSGDLGRPDDPVMHAPDRLAATDWLVLESTYGDRLHPDEDPYETLAGIVNRTAARGGTVLLPSFAVGRSQALMYLLSRLMDEHRIPELPVFLDSPMAIDVTGVFRHFRSEHRLTQDACDRLHAMVTYTRSPEESEALASNRYPKIIIAGAGMLNGGRILHHLIAFGADPRNAVVIAGYQAEGTRGDALLKGKRSLRIFGRDVPIACEVAQVEGLSAHADWKEILEWLRPVDRAPQRVFVTHGEPVAADSLRQKLEHELAWSAQVPEQDEEFDLD